MRITTLTLFPEFFTSPLESGLMGRAVREGLVAFDFRNPRDFAQDRHKSVDDSPYGGGPGMVMFVEPILAALDSVQPRGRVISLTPRGRPLTQDYVRELAAEPALTLVCGRYEGIDARLPEVAELEEVAVGDVVLNGGESAALCLMEAVARLVPGFMGKAASGAEESFSAGLLEYPHYTRPEEFQGLRVPEVLLSGDHARIATWRREQALEATLARRPELLAEAPLDGADLDHLASLSRLRLGRNLGVCLVHYPVVDRRGEVRATSLTNLDLHDISRVSRSYGIGAFYAVTPLADQQELARKLVDHWTTGPGAAANPDRAAAMALVSIQDSLADAAAHMAARCGREPVLVATSARRQPGLSPGQVRRMLEDEPVMLVFGTGNGLAPQALAVCRHVLRPLRALDDYRHLSVRTAAAVTLDRILGDAY